MSGTFELMIKKVKGLLKDYEINKYYKKKIDKKVDTLGMYIAYLLSDDPFEPILNEKEIMNVYQIFEEIDNLYKKKEENIFNIKKKLQ